MAANEIDIELNKYLADVHSIEEQALTQLRRAPGIAGNEALAAIFERHLGETADQEERIRERLEARDAEPSKLKDAAGKAGGLGMIAFARLNPDTPGKLVAHAFSYEHLEIAAYRLLETVALAAGDRSTAALAGEIAAEEQRMADRLEGAFSIAADTSLRELDRNDLGKQLDKYLAEAHAIEMQAEQLLASAPRLVDDDRLIALFAEHLEETQRQASMVAERLEARGASPSRLQDTGMRLQALNLGVFFAVQPDTAPKLAGFAFAFEHLEIAGYRLLRQVAERAGDAATIEVADIIVPQEQAMARRLDASFDELITATLAERGVTS